MEERPEGRLRWISKGAGRGRCAEAVKRLRDDALIPSSKMPHGRAAFARAG
jgi:hypothetical protein